MSEIPHSKESEIQRRLREICEEMLIDAEPIFEASRQLDRRAAYLRARRATRERGENPDSIPEPK